MGFKLIILAGIGLGALYLMHLLAQDYMKIRQPVAKLANFLLTKRDLSAVLNSTTIEPEPEPFKIDWDRILKNDPLNCALSLVCQITAGAEKDNSEARIIETLIQYGLNIGAPKSIENAYGYGLKVSKDFEKCYKHYPYCPYSAKTMLKILEIYSHLFGG